VSFSIFFFICILQLVNQTRLMHLNFMSFKTNFPRIRDSWLAFLSFRSLISNTSSASLGFLQASGSKTKYFTNQSATAVFFNSPNV